MAKAETTIDQDFKITIPKAARKALGLSVGDKVEPITNENSITFRTKGITATAEEKRLIARGQREYERGEYVTLEQHLREMDNTNNKILKERAPKNR